MILESKKLTASPSKTTPGAVVISAPSSGTGVQGTDLKAAETPSQALLSRYIASRLKQFGTR